MSTYADAGPAMVFHAAQMIADEAIARDWSIWDFVDRVGTLDPQVDVLAYMLFAASAQFDDVAMRADAHMGEDFPLDMERVFGIDAEVWRRTLALAKAFPERIQPLDAAASWWFDLTESE